MNARPRRSRSAGLLIVAVSVALAACGTEAASPDPDPTPTPTETAGVSEVNVAAAASSSGKLERGSYYVDPDGDPSTPMRVHITIAGDGWGPPMGSWPGVAKEVGADEGDMLVSIATLANVAQDGCETDQGADPPVGPGVGDFADAFAALTPFEVVSAPADVTAFGYEGKHLEMKVANLDDCFNGNAFSWITPGVDDEPFFGYGLNGTESEMWILDVDGTPLMIEVMKRPGATSEDATQMQAIVDSIRIEE